MINILAFKSGYMQSNSYIIMDGNHGIVIDPSDVDVIFKTVDERNLIIDFAIVTHEHCDHMYGCGKVREKYGCPVYASETCGDNMGDERKNFSHYYNAFVGIQTKYTNDIQKSIEPFKEKVDVTFENEKVLKWMDHSLYMRETPGHSPGSICILLDDNCLFVGDTLLKDELTGVRFYGSSKKQLLGISVPWLMNLPGEIKVYPGHGDPFLLGERLTKPIV